MARGWRFALPAHESQGLRGQAAYAILSGGRVSERFKELPSKCSMPKRHRGFESRPFRRGDVKRVEEPGGRCATRARRAGSFNFLVVSHH
jgi:hypothetical protein